jgi:hypothetical protein
LRNGAGAHLRLHLLVELAKIKEHRRREYAEAERLTREAMSLRQVLSQYPRASSSGEPTAGDLEQRLARILRRRRTSG